jgi:biotin operon repressor
MLQESNVKFCEMMDKSAEIISNKWNIKKTTKSLSSKNLKMALNKVEENRTYLYEGLYQDIINMFIEEFVEYTDDAYIEMRINQMNYHKTIENEKKKYIYIIKLKNIDLVDMNDTLCHTQLLKQCIKLLETLALEQKEMKLNAAKFEENIKVQFDKVTKIELFTTCDKVNLKTAGYSAIEAKNIKSSFESIKLAGYSVKEVKGGGYSIQEVKEVGYSIQEIKEGGYSIQEIKEGGYSIQEVKEGGYSIQEIKEGGYSIQEVKEGGYSIQEVKEGGYSVKEINEGDILLKN